MKYNLEGSLSQGPDSAGNRSQAPDSRRILYVCVATESKLYLPYLQKLIPNLIILGLNTKWKGVITKYKLFRKYLNSVEDDRIVVFIDAYDVLPTKNIDKLEKQFINFSIKNPDVKMIVGFDKVRNIIVDKIET